jgi:hypothetical protein
MIALLPGLPFPLISAMSRGDALAASERPSAADADSSGPGDSESTDDQTQPRIRLEPEETEAERTAFIDVGANMKMRNPARGFFANPLRPLLLATACAMCLLGRRRRMFVIAVGASLAVAAALLVPSLCTFALRALREEWILLRAESFLNYMLPVLAVPAFLAWPTRRAGATSARRAIMTTALAAALIVTPAVAFGPLNLQVLAGVAFASLLVLPRRLLNDGWSRSLFAVGLFAACALVNCPLQKISDYLHDLRLPPAWRFRVMHDFRKAQHTLSEFVPSGARIACPIEATSRLGAMLDVYFVTSLTTSVGVPDLPQRTLDNQALIDPRTPWPQRRELLRKYNVRHLVIWRGEDLAWARDHTVRRNDLHWEFILLEIDPDS